MRASTADVTAAIESLAARSQQIGGIVDTITAIAEQTNLLALNAAIEAARAGEQGRGFAVVAEEVRKLAEESSHAAREIGGLIGEIRAETGRAVEVVSDGARRTVEGAETVERAREAFATIGASVDDVTGRIEQIAAAAARIAGSAERVEKDVEEIAAIAEQSSAATEEVSASTEQTSASTQQVSASAQELRRTATELAEMVAAFRLEAGSRRMGDVRAAPAGDFDYEAHGARLRRRRRPDPRIAAQIHAALGDARTVLNVGAGAGSYEPEDRHVVAVEPSAAMRAQRPAHLAPAIDATAEALPFDDGGFDAAMARSRSTSGPTSTPGWPSCGASPAGRS